MKYKFIWKQSLCIIFEVDFNFMKFTKDKKRNLNADILSK